jgi:aromatic-L-amino-acid decarboxylase
MSDRAKPPESERPSVHLRLEPPRDVQEQWLGALARFVFDHMEGLERAPATGPVGSDATPIIERVSRPIAEEPLPGGIDEVIRLLDEAASASLNAPAPGYFAYIPGGGIYTAALADFVADCLNRYTGLSAPSPALFRLAQDVLSWLCSSFGYGPTPARCSPGGSLANLAAVVTARHDTSAMRGSFERAIVYPSTQAHHSVA